MAAVLPDLRRATAQGMSPLIKNYNIVYFALKLVDVTQLSNCLVDNLLADAKPTASCVWSGDLPSSARVSSPMSTKVFLGGVPWDVTEDLLVAAFLPFGNITVEWPNNSSSAAFKGYVYIIFEREDQVRLASRESSLEFKVLNTRK